MLPPGYQSLILDASLIYERLFFLTSDSFLSLFFILFDFLFLLLFFVALNRYNQQQQYTVSYTQSVVHSSKHLGSFGQRR